MKKFIFASLFVISTSTFASDPIMGAFTTTGGFVTTMNIYDCVAKEGDNRFGRCYLAATSSTVLGAVVLKEDLAGVEPDIYNFLAGEEISLALEQQIHAVREEIPEAQEMSDEEVAALMLEIINA